MTDEGKRRELGQRFPVVIAPYDPFWPERFRQEEARLRGWFDTAIMPRIEHIGSTAVPGLAAKATIDILCQIRSFEEAREVIVPVLEPEGYFCNLRENPNPDHFALWWGYFPDQPIRVHIHLAPEGHTLFDTLVFRDWLRTHPETVRDYEELKRKLEAEYRHDRDGYTDAKGGFIRQVLELARTG